MTTETQMTETSGAAPAGDAITLTDGAVAQIRKLQESDPTVGSAPVRVRVAGGGCSGMSYKLDFDREGEKPGDKAFGREGVKLVVDSKSYLFLKGMTLDYSGGLNGKGFEFHNPNAKRTCGCGASFAV
jgi:iron-sulfur cluster assembly protein